MSPCLSDDGTGPDPCYWDAHEMGNGHGASFVMVDGQVHPVTDMPDGIPYGAIQTVTIVLIVALALWAWWGRSVR
jgi:hypothetical protein